MEKPVAGFSVPAFHPTPFRPLLTPVTGGHPPDLLADQLAPGLIQTQLLLFLAVWSLNRSAGEGVSNTSFKSC